MTDLLPAHQLCWHFAHDQCAYGDRCVKQHGEDDTREPCVDCGAVRVPAEYERCVRCYRAYRETNRIADQQRRANEAAARQRAREERPTNHNACKKCDEERIRLELTGEMFCRTCDEIRGCVTCGRPTARSACRECHAAHASRTMRRCRTCNAKVYPGAEGCEFCDA